MEGQHLAGFSVGSNNNDKLKVSHHLSTNDTLIFCGKDLEQLQNLKCVLLCFKAVSVLKINLGKPPEVEALAQILGCKVSNLPLKQLGLLLGSKFKSKIIRNLILEKMERRLSGQKDLLV